MKNNKIIICRGLPASGKTTWANNLVAWANNLASKDKKVVKVVKVEKDEIRKEPALFKGGVYSHRRGDEQIVLKERDKRIREALLNGLSVVSSDTNLTRKHINRMTQIANECGVEVEIVSFLDTPLKDVIERDAQRDAPVGEQVIRRMFHNHVKTLPTFLKYDSALPCAVVCDIDGTLTRGPRNRSPYEWSKVGNDLPNEGVTLMLDGIAALNHGAMPLHKNKVYIFSGRDSVCRPETEKWLHDNGIEYDMLVMRKKHDTRSDEIVKSEFVETHIKGKVNVLIWFDDRQRVSTMLRDVYGINVAQIGDTRYSF